MYSSNAMIDFKKTENSSRNTRVKSSFLSPFNTRDQFTGLIMVILRNGQKLLGVERVRIEIVQWPLKDQKLTSSIQKPRKIHFCDIIDFFEYWPRFWGNISLLLPKLPNQSYSNWPGNWNNPNSINEIHPAWALLCSAAVCNMPQLPGRAYQQCTRSQCMSVCL